MIEQILFATAVLLLSTFTLGVAVDLAWDRFVDPKKRSK